MGVSASAGVGVGSIVGVDVGVSVHTVLRYTSRWVWGCWWVLGWEQMWF